MSVELRQATQADNQAILAFISRHAMQSELQLRFDRSPDFFALLAAHSDRHETWLLLQDGCIVALGSYVIRPGYIRGGIEPIVYLSDLRVAPIRGVAGRWRKHFRELMTEVAARTRARYAFCAVIRDNQLALNSITRQSALGFHHLCGYATISLLARKPMQRLGKVDVRLASANDFGQLQNLLDRDSGSRMFGPVFDHDELRRRLDSWPGFGIESFIVAVDSKNDIVGCVAPWDYAALKRIVIDAMPRAADWLRRAFNLLAPLHGRAKVLPAPGAVLPDIALTHVAVRDRDVDVFAALLLAAMQRVIRNRKAATLSLCLFDDDPLRSVLGDYWHYAVPMDLYALRIDAAAPELCTAGTNLPGFEFYLV